MVFHTPSQFEKESIRADYVEKRSLLTLKKILPEQEVLTFSEITLLSVSGNDD